MPLTADSFYDWDGNSAPEELCFYRKNSSWFLSICHEKIAVVLENTREDVEFLENKGIKIGKR